MPVVTRPIELCARLGGVWVEFHGTLRPRDHRRMGRSDRVAMLAMIDNSLEINGPPLSRLLPRLQERTRSRRIHCDLCPKLAIISPSMHPYDPLAEAYDSNLLASKLHTSLKPLATDSPYPVAFRNKVPAIQYHSYNKPHTI